MPKLLGNRHLPFLSSFGLFFSCSAFHGNGLGTHPQERLHHASKMSPQERGVTVLGCGFSRSLLRSRACFSGPHRAGDLGVHPVPDVSPNSHIPSLEMGRLG